MTLLETKELKIGELNMIHEGNGVWTANLVYTLVAPDGETATWDEETQALWYRGMKLVGVKDLREATLSMWVKDCIGDMDNAPTHQEYCLSLQVHSSASVPTIKDNN